MNQNSRSTKNKNTMTNMSIIGILVGIKYIPDISAAFPRRTIAQVPSDSSWD